VATLTEARLQDEAGDASFRRGQDYVKYVVGLRVNGSRARASIQAKNVYEVELDWGRHDIRCSCTCPFFDQGFFCKHLVAVGLAAIDAGHGLPAEPRPVAPDVAQLVAAMDETEIRSLLVSLAEQDDGVRRTVELRAVARTGDVSVLAAELDEMVKKALSFRGFVDYRRSFEVARSAEQLLDELETYLDTGSADVLQPALLRAVTRLRKVVEQADDSSGLLGNACQRAGELYARACCEGRPDGKKLARWLVKFRDSSPGWPIMTLDDFVGAFDEQALATYRREVAKVDAAYGSHDQWKRSEVDRMLIELADHDGDVDRAVELLSGGEHTQYGAIVERLRAAGRDDDVVEWIDRAVAGGQVSGHGGGNDYWLDPVAVARTYLSLGRASDGVGVLRAEFVRRPELKTFRQLLDYAEETGDPEAERSWALAKARELATQPFGSGAVLIEIALAEGDLETAWSAARELGAGYRWKELADASRDYAPLDAAGLWRADVEKDLRYPDSQRYPDIARRLAIMRDLYTRGDAEADFATYMAELRETYKRRPALMSALDHRGL
jgi:hypothetical protein